MSVDPDGRGFPRRESDTQRLKTAGQVAYESWAFGWESDPEKYGHSAPASSADPWSKLSHEQRRDWERIAADTRSHVVVMRVL